MVHPDGRLERPHPQSLSSLPPHLSPPLGQGRKCLKEREVSPHPRPPLKKGEGATLTDWVLSKYPKMKGVGEPLMLADGTAIDRPGIVHRLDKDTSGVLILAKNQVAYAFLKRQFETRTIEKTYEALVVGAPKDESGMIDMPIGRSASDFRKWSAKGARTGELREAKTAYKIKERFSKYSLLELHPKTGRTHQIRVHLFAIGHPIVGDSLYGKKGGSPLGVTRQLLHARSLKLALPKGGIKSFEAPLPADFKRVLASLRKSC